MKSCVFVQKFQAKFFMETIFSKQKTNIMMIDCKSEKQSSRSIAQKWVKKVNSGTGFSGKQAT